MKRNELLTKDIKTLFFEYLTPAIGGMLGTAAYVVGDTIMIGQGVGAQGIGALNMVLPVFRLTNGIALALGIGGATTVSVLRGQEREDLANNVFNIAMFLSLILGTILLFARIFFLDNIVSFLGATEGTYQMVRDYLGVLLPMTIFIGIDMALGIFIRNDGSPKLVMMATLTSSVFNLVMDYIFVFPMQLGIWGAALATVLSPVLSIMILSTHFIRKKNTLYFKMPEFDSYYIKRILTNGFPSFIVEITIGIAIYLFNISLIKMSGDMGVAVYGMIMNLQLFAVAIFNGVGQAMQPIVSINYGARKYERSVEAGKLAMRTALGLGIFFCAIGVIFPEGLAKIFTSERGEIISMAKTAIRIYFTSFLFMGLNIATISYIQSRENIRESIMVSLLKGSVFVILFLTILPKFFGVNGIWLTVPMAELFTFLTYSLVSKEMKELR